MPDTARALVDYVDQNKGAEASSVIIEIVLASCHPDFVMSLVSATALPSSLRRAISDYLTYILLHGLTREEQQKLFAWAQAKMLAGP
ncbi:hypothetical protein [Massilia sp.]|uniref:hypothetical protein n=1 Tax=Massilia sp. TaxID=1882437 RepID=UPI00352C7689